MKEVIDSLFHVLNAQNLPETPTTDVCDDCFDEALDKVQDSVCRIVDTFTCELGDQYAHEAALLALLGNIHEMGGAAACLSTLKEAVSALQAWETAPSRERLTLVRN